MVAESTHQGGESTNWWCGVGVANSRVFLAPDSRSPTSQPHLLRFRWAFLEVRDLIRVWSVPLQTSEADAVTLESGLVFEAGLAPYNLKPVVAENYGTADSKFLQGPRTEFVALVLSWQVLSCLV